MDVYTNMFVALTFAPFPFVRPCPATVFAMFTGVDKIGADNGAFSGRFAKRRRTAPEGGGGGLRQQRLHVLFYLILLTV